jgi:hypothetical protein
VRRTLLAVDNPRRAGWLDPGQTESFLRRASDLSDWCRPRQSRIKFDLKRGVHARPLGVHIFRSTKACRRMFRLREDIDCRPLLALRHLAARWTLAILTCPGGAKGPGTDAQPSCPSMTTGQEHVSRRVSIGRNASPQSSTRRGARPRSSARPGWQPYRDTGRIQCGKSN